MKRFEHGHVVSFVGEAAGAGESGRAGTDDRYLVPVFLRWDRVFVPIFMAPVIIGGEAFERADSDRLSHPAAHAFAFALVFLGTYSAAYRGKQIGRGDDLISAADIAFFDFLNKFRNADAYGTSRHTRRIFTGEASRGLCRGILCGVPKRDLIKVVGAPRSFLLRHRRFFRF